VGLRTVDYADHHLQYRVVGELVQRSTDGGWQWATILTPAGAGAAAAATWGLQVWDRYV
jgi:hypothetical protein